MRRLAKTTIAAALSWSGAHEWLGRRRPATPLILGYHRVVENVQAVQGKLLPGMTISQRMLRAHLEWVGRRYRIVSLDELGARLQRGEPCDELAAITFDDGYLDVHDHALPVLRQMGLPAAVFVVSSLVGTNHLPLHDELFEIVKDVSGEGARRAMPDSLAEALRECGHDPFGGPIAMVETVRALLDFPAAKLTPILDDLRAHGWHNVPPRALVTMDWSALEAMQRADVTIGSHTHTHALLDREDDERLREELSRSRAVLEAGLGRPVRHLAYPDGRFNLRVARAVAAAGYDFAYSICDHSVEAAPLLTIPRVMLWEGSCANAFGGFSPGLMQCHAASVLPFPSRCNDDHGEQSQVQSC
jgi:peptidoglycan/xylan/chitin deacetylase (PgdA/CDA1 family)